MRISITTSLILTLLPIHSSTAFSSSSSVISSTLNTYRHPPPLSAKRKRDYQQDDYEEDEYYYQDEDEEYYTPPRRRSPTPQTSPFGFPKLQLPQSVSTALLAGTFVLGIGTGVTVDSQINTSPKDLASRDAVDQAAPNPRLCSTYGASAMAFDQRVFVSFNPFNVYVAQADVKPACVLRESNVVPVLQDRGLVNGREVRSCKQNMNTWAFVGDLNDYPQLSCVYKSEDAQNEFLSNPKYGIGEDVWDDDREAMEVKRKSGKNVKNGMTEGERVAYEQALKLKKDALLKENGEKLM